jgi:hypothetical protein
MGSLELEYLATSGLQLCQRVEVPVVSFCFKFGDRGGVTPPDMKARY